MTKYIKASDDQIIIRLNVFSPILSTTYRSRTAFFSTHAMRCNKHSMHHPARNAPPFNAFPLLPSSFLLPLRIISLYDFSSSPKSHIAHRTLNFTPTSISTTNSSPLLSTRRPQPRRRRSSNSRCTGGRRRRCSSGARRGNRELEIRRQPAWRREWQTTWWRRWEWQTARERRRDCGCTVGAGREGEGRTAVWRCWELVRDGYG